MSRELQYISSGITRYNAMNPMSASRGIITPQRISNYIAPFQFERIAHDIGMWRDAVREMEQTFYPSRVKTMRMFIDVIENPFVKAVYERWQELTTQRDYTIYQIKGSEKIPSVDLTQQISSQYWVNDYIENVIDAMMWGYSLISLGDIVDDEFPNITSVQRENILPDGVDRSGRPVLTQMTYGMDGIEIKDGKLIDMFNHWIPTKSPRGVSTCGYGMLYNISLCEIHLRHILEWNVDFAEQYAQPIKKGTTNKTGKARQKFERFLASGASNQWVLLDKGTNDDIEYVMAANAGTAWKTYDNLETRLKGIISQILLGHTDAISSTPGKLGGMQAANKDGFNESLIEQAMNAKQIRAGDFTSRVMNQIFAPKIREIGQYTGSKVLKNLIPVGYQFGLLNDKEEEEVRRRRNADRMVTSQYVEKFNNAGWNVDAKQLSEHVGWKMTPGAPQRELLEKRITETTINKPDDDGSVKKD